MPKLIPQLEEQIINTAEKMFINDGFDLVSMRKLARELEIAVGTLYNYFPNKTALFFSIMQKSWEKTFDELIALSEKEEISESPARKKAIEIIYKGIKGRGGFALKTLNPSEDQKNRKTIGAHHSFNNDELVKKLETVLLPFGAGFSGSESGRVVRMLLATIRIFTFQSGMNDSKGDINFLLNIVELS